LGEALERRYGEWVGVVDEGGRAELASHGREEDGAAGERFAGEQLPPSGKEGGVVGVLLGQVRVPAGDELVAEKRR